MARSANEILNDVKATASDKAQKVRDRRKTKKTLSARLHDFKLAWEAGQREGGCEGIPVRITSAKDQRLVKDQILKAPAVSDGSFDSEDFAKWVTSNWAAIGEHYFTKSRKYPAFPAVAWLIACMPKYLEAYRNRDMLDFDAAKRGLSMAQQVTRTNRQAEATEKQLQSIARELEMERAHNKTLEKELREAQQSSVKGKRRKAGKRKVVNGLDVIKIDFDQTW